MNVRSIKANFVFSNVRLAMSLLLPMVVFPYVSRVLGPEGVGRVEYTHALLPADRQYTRVYFFFDITRRQV